MHYFCGQINTIIPNAMIQMKGFYFFGYFYFTQRVERDGV